MNQNPFFSIIIPVYQTASFLKTCLDSVLNQTETDFEVIVVNDASPDNSSDILKKYQQQYPTIRVITFHQNQGVSSARNDGLKHARGQYVYFLDEQCSPLRHFNFKPFRTNIINLQICNNLR